MTLTIKPETCRPITIPVRFKGAAIDEFLISRPPE